MKSLPKIGLYIPTKKAEGMRLCITNAYGDEPEEFYLVEIVNEASEIGDELDKEQWEELVKEYGLKFQG